MKLQHLLFKTFQGLLTISLIAAFVWATLYFLEKEAIRREALIDKYGYITVN